MNGNRVERRLAAVLAADVAGYSRLMGLDEVGTARTLREHRAVSDALVAKHAGRIVKTTGDGVLLEFPSVVDAVECAVAVQAVMAERNDGVPQDRRMLYRIGINLGDILIEGEDILGDGVNVAARLEGIAEPGGICISSSAYEQVRGKVAVEFADLGEQRLKNIDRPVRVYTARPKVALGLVAPLGPQPEPYKPPPLPDKPSIAVLPFQNMSGDPEQEYFADGMVEDIITALSRFPQIFVIARNSSFIYKGRAVDIKKVSHELGVRYVLEGGVRKSANRVRITGQLIDATTGAHIWADRFDGTLDDVFDLQDRVTASVVGAITPKLEQAEIERAKRKPTESLDAHDLYLRALPLAWAYSAEETVKAIPLLDQALNLDPGYAAAHGLAAYCHMRGSAWGVGDLTDTAKTTAVRHARTVLSTDTDDATALALSAYVVGLLEGDFDITCRALEKALALNPNSAQAFGFGAALYSFAGRFEAAIDCAHRSLRLSPFDPLRYVPLTALSRAYFLSTRYEEAIEAALRATDANPRFVPAYVWLVTAEVHLGHMAQALEAKRRLLQVTPNFRFARWAGFTVASTEQREAIAAPLREAGVPE